MGHTAGKRYGGIKQCAVCESEFSAYRSTDKFCSSLCRWRHSHNKPEVAERRKAKCKEWGKNNKDHRRNYQLKYTYGITLDQYYELLKAQNDCCGICGKHISEDKRLFAVDHDHRTREIFGILCNFCNFRLVGRNRKPELFLKAAKYLEKGTGWFVPVKKKKKRKKRK